MNIMNYQLNRSILRKKTSISMHDRGSSAKLKEVAANSRTNCSKRAL